MSVSSLFVKISFYFYEINGITTKQDIEVTNNLNSVLEGVERLLFNNNQYLYVRFYYMGSYYQVQNKNLIIKQL